VVPRGGSWGGKKKKREDIQKGTRKNKKKTDKPRKGQGKNKGNAVQREKTRLNELDEKEEPPPDIKKGVSNVRARPGIEFRPSNKKDETNSIKETTFSGC